MSHSTYRTDSPAISSQTYRADIVVLLYSHATERYVSPRYDRCRIVVSSRPAIIIPMTLRRIDKWHANAGRTRKLRGKSEGDGTGETERERERERSPRFAATNLIKP